MTHGPGDAPHCSTPTCQRYAAASPNWKAPIDRLVGAATSQ